MCGGPKQSNPSPSAPSSPQETESITKAMDNPIEPVGSQQHSFSAFLELVADNDVDGFKQSLEGDPNKHDEVGLWYTRQRASKRTLLSHRTPLMVASMYGSVDIVKLILSISREDINRSVDLDKSTALHCAASGGSIEAIHVVKLLLLAGADPNSLDSVGNRPFDVVIGPNSKALKEMLKTESSVMSSPSSTRKDYPIDPSIPDIRNSIYSSDEFRMFSFKVRPCSRSYTHDWTECPFVHPGENARRRDPKRFHYSCVPCPDHRKAPCRRGDSCEYAHGVFESLLHPAQYRTRICKDGVSCARRVCFFAHRPAELRPLYLSTGSAVPSPPMSPHNGIGASQSSAMPWPQQNIAPTLHLQASHLQIRRLRSSLSSRDEFLSHSLNRSPTNGFSPRSLQSQASFQGIIEPLSPFRSRPIANQNQIRSLSSYDIGASEFGWSQWDSLPIGKVDWSVKEDELGRLRRSFSNNAREPEVSSFQSLLKESESDIAAMVNLLISGEAFSNPDQVVALG